MERGKQNLSRSFILMHSQIFEVLWEGERAYFEVKAFVIEDFSEMKYLPLALAL